MLAYCSKCRIKRQITHSKMVAIGLGKPALQGECSVCGMRLVAFIKAREQAHANA